VTHLAFQDEWEPAFKGFHLTQALDRVPAEFSAGAFLQDRADRGGSTPGRARQAVASREAVAALGSAVPGLVQVPTTCPHLAATPTAARSKALRAALRATEQDKARSRLVGLRRAVGFSARAIGAALDRPGFRSHYVAMVTLTYADGDDWRPDHVTQYLHTVRKWLGRRGHRMHYVWVAELQKRGALHYHVALWLPPGVKIPKPDKSGMWAHGWSNITQARDAAGYLMKYLSKGTDVLGYPKGARCHGSGGMEHVFKRARRWLGLPAFIRARADIHDDWRRAVGGGWADPDGFVIPSEYERAWLGDRWGPVRVADYGRPFQADGPFSWLGRGH